MTTRRVMAVSMTLAVVTITKSPGADVWGVDFDARMTQIVVVATLFPAESETSMESEVGANSTFKKPMLDRKASSSSNPKRYPVSPAASVAES